MTSRTHSRTQVRSLLAVVGLAVAFGVLDAHLWQQSSTFWIANLSAAYLVLAFVSGCLVSRSHVVFGALTGVGSTILALSAFYLWRVHTGYLAPELAQTQFLRYALPGCLSGLVFGALGHRWARLRSWWAAAPLALALMLEPQAWTAHLGYLPRPYAVWHIETALGVILALVVAVVAIQARRGPSGHSSSRL